MKEVTREEKGNVKNIIEKISLSGREGMRRGNLEWQARTITEAGKGGRGSGEERRKGRKEGRGSSEERRQGRQGGEAVMTGGRGGREERR